MSIVLEKEQALALCQQILSRCGSDPAEVVLIAGEQALTRFAGNAIHQNVAERNASLHLRLYLGNRRGQASTNRLDPDGLDELAARARAAAQASPEDLFFTGLPGPAKYAQVLAFDPETANCSPDRRAARVEPVCRAANEKGLDASGAFSTGVHEVAVANSAGLFAYHAHTDADFQTVVMGQDASGRSQQSAWKADDLPIEALGLEAIATAGRGRDPRPLEAGSYPVVLDPQAVQDLVNLLNTNGAGAQQVLDGRSWMNGRQGQKSMSPLVSLWDDGNDPSGLPLPFDYEGTPRQRVEIVSQGVVGSPVYDRRTAGRAGTHSTGHALSPDQPSFMRGVGPLAQNLFLGRGESSPDELIASTRRGLFITRFWYTRLVHPRDCVVTGMTRDGVFWIENGEIAYPVKNLRFTQSYVQALAEVEAVGRETRLLKTEYGSRAIRVPALKIGGFNFTGMTV
jgi:predicted Zn-dependent protease